MTKIETPVLETIQKNAKEMIATASEMQRQKQDVGRIEFVKGSGSTNIIIESPKGVVCTRLDKINETPHEEVVNKYLTTIVTPGTNKSTAEHYASLRNVICIIIPKNAEIKDPIIIKKTAQGNARHHVLIIAEESSEATIIESENDHTNEENNSKETRTTIVEVLVKENAELFYTCIQNYGKSCQHYVKKHAIVKKDARMHWVEAYFGAAYTNSTISSTLEENGSSSTNTTIFFGDDTQKFDLRSQTFQQGKNTLGDMKAIGVVRDDAKSMCNGLIKIEQESYGSQGHQKAKTLLMNRNAQANAIPSMEIDNFDVSATHEASVGQINENQLFYLMARGLNEKEARNKIVEGFFTPIIDKIKNQDIQKQMSKLIEIKLHKGKE